MGLLVVPQSLARLHHRRDVTYRPVADAPQSSVVLSWPEEATTELVEDFIGIVRGRTVNSTRGRTQPAAQPQSQPKAKGAETSGARRKPAAGKPTRGGGAKGAKRGKPRRRS